MHRDGPFAFHLAWIDAPVWRLGLVVPKRHEPKAVTRNTVRRRWREAFRRRRVAWAAEFGGADLVVRLHAPLVRPEPGAAKRKPGRVMPPPATRGSTPRLTARSRATFDADAMLTRFADRLRTKPGLRRPTDRAAG